MKFMETYGETEWLEARADQRFLGEVDSFAKTTYFLFRTVSILDAAAVYAVGRGKRFDGRFVCLSRDD